jgi:hypothetical protein
LSHLSNVHRCNDSTNPSCFVAIDTEFDGNHDNNGDRRPILRLISLGYTTPTGQAILFLVDLKEVDEMNESDKIQIKTKLRELFVAGRERMVAFDFTQDKITLDWAGLLPDNMQGAFVRDLKTNPVIMACCDSCDCNPTSGTPLGLSDVSKVMINKKIDKKMQYSNWTMDNNL